MFFNEFALTPHVFRKEYCEYHSKELISFLRDVIRDFSLIANINNKQWQQDVISFIHLLSPDLKDKLSQLLQELKRCNRLVTHTTLLKDKLLDEQEWISHALKEDQIEPYETILHTGISYNRIEKVMTLEEFTDKIFLKDRPDSFLVKQTRDNIKSYLNHFLMYARKLTIIDPYFTHQGDASALELFAELYAKRRGNRMINRKIILHVRYKENLDTKQFRNMWGRACQEIFEKYGHEVIMNMWHDNNPIKVIHARMMITDQGGIDSDRGFGFANAESNWKLLSNELIRKRLNLFEPNIKNDISLAFTITKSDFDNNQSVLRGIVKKILHDNERGKVGFIQGDREDYYFQIPAHIQFTKEVQLGREVEFELQKTDKGKAAFIKKVY